MSIESNKAVARRFIEEVWNTGDLAAGEALLAPDLVNHDPDGRTTNRAGFLQFLNETRNAFPDLRFRIDDMIGEGDRVATRVSVQGRQSGDFEGAAPSGQPVSWTGIGIVRIADGRIIEQWAETAVAGTTPGSQQLQPE